MCLRAELSLFIEKFPVFGMLINETPFVAGIGKMFAFDRHMTGDGNDDDNNRGYMRAESAGRMGWNASKSIYFSKFFDVVYLFFIEGTIFDGM